VIESLIFFSSSTTNKLRVSIAISSRYYRWTFLLMGAFVVLLL